MTDVAVELGGQFRSRGLAEAFVSTHRAELARWPLPVDPLDVAGDDGTTGVQVCGRPTGAPLVLLHGGGCTSTSWFANVGALGDAHRVYAPDQIGDAGPPPPAPGASRDPGPRASLPPRPPPAGYLRAATGTGATVPAHAPAPRSRALSPGTARSRNPLDAKDTSRPRR
ncbi:MAG TPA: hypothetical protein VE152_08855 [Acidimicrobiales bacterium]|nr:hypothetical protein [Acidimicrobiales bacterium]